MASQPPAQSHDEYSLRSVRPTEVGICNEHVPSEDKTDNRCSHGVGNSGIRVDEYFDVVDQVEVGELSFEVPEERYDPCLVGGVPGRP